MNASGTVSTMLTKVAECSYGGHERPKTSWLGRLCHAEQDVHRETSTHAHEEKRCRYRRPEGKEKRQAVEEGEEHGEGDRCVTLGHDLEALLAARLIEEPVERVEESVKVEEVKHIETGNDRQDCTQIARDEPASAQ